VEARHPQGWWISRSHGSTTRGSAHGSSWGGLPQAAKNFPEYTGYCINPELLCG